MFTKAIFRAWFSWGVARSKWDGCRTAFYGFDLAIVAAYSPGDMARLANTLAGGGCCPKGRL